MNKFLGNKDKEHVDIDLDEIMLCLTCRCIMNYAWNHKIEDDDPDFTKWSIQKFCEGNQTVIMMVIFHMPTSPNINPHASDVHASYKELFRLLNKHLAIRKGKDVEYDYLVGELIKADMRILELLIMSAHF